MAKPSKVPSRSIPDTRSGIEHIPASHQCESASIYPLEDMYDSKIVGYRAVLSTGRMRDFETHMHAVAWVRFMLDLEPNILQ